MNSKSETHPVRSAQNRAVVQQKLVSAFVEDDRIEVWRELTVFKATQYQQVVRNKYSVPVLPCIIFRMFSAVDPLLST